MKVWFKIFFIGWGSCFIPWGFIGLAAGLIPVILASTLVYFFVVKKKGEHGTIGL